MAKVYLPKHFKNEDAMRFQELIKSHEGFEQYVINFDETGFWAEVPDQYRELYEEVMQVFFRSSTQTT